MAEAEFCLSNIFSEHGPISYEELISLFPPEELAAGSLGQLTEEELKRYKTAKTAARRSVIIAAILAVVILGTWLTIVLNNRVSAVITKETVIGVYEDSQIMSELSAYQ